MSEAILLFAHGARDPAWALPFNAIRDAVAQAAPGIPVELAFLELMEPALPDAAARLVAQGARAITVVPLFMAQGSHLKKDLPLLMERLRTQHPGLQLQLTPAIGDVPELSAAIARWVTQAAQTPAAHPLPTGLAAPARRPDEHEREARRSVVAAAHWLSTSGLSPSTSGNLSVRCGTGLLITPSGRRYQTLEPQDLVWMDFEGRYEHPLKPSSEWQMHRDIYSARADVNAVVHAHPMHATTLAIRHMEIPPLHYMIAVAGGPSIRCAPYHTYGTRELSQAAVVALRDRNCCLLANHGMIAAGPGLERALWIAEETETLAQQYVLTLQIGGPTLLDEAEIARVVERFRTYGPDAPRRDSERNS